MVDELFNLLKTRITTNDAEMVRNVLMLLQRDHYVGREANGAYGFRLQLIRRWWRLDRGV